METKDEDTLPFRCDSIPKWMLKKCEEELNETPDRKAEALLEIRSLLRSIPVTSEVNFHEDFLVQYLRRNKYRVKNAQEQILNLAKAAEKDNLFKTASDSYADLPSHHAFQVMPRRCPEGCVVVRIRLGKWNTNEVPLTAVKSMFSSATLQLLRDPMTQINGIRFIYDFKDVTVQHMRFCTPYNLHLLYHGALNCIPGRYKSVHLINESIFLKAIWTVVKPFVSEKIRKRIFFHSTFEELFEHLPRSVVPVEYGGTVTDDEVENWVKISNRNQETFTLAGQPNFY